MLPLVARLPSPRGGLPAVKVTSAEYTPGEVVGIGCARWPERNVAAETCMLPSQGRFRQRSDLTNVRG